MESARRAPYLFPEGAKLGQDNVVLQARARRHRVDGYAGPLSIKTVIAGNVAWVVNGRSLVLDSSSFLILNAGERYSMDIDSARPVETCCVFFAPGFVERTVLDSTSPMEAALDDPCRQPPDVPYLTAVHGDPERDLASHVHSLAPRCRRILAPSGFEEDFLLLAGRLLGFYARIREQAARVPAARASTRAELYRRLLTGRDYLHARGSGPVSLAEVARRACLSPYHFHRGFTKAFEQTPHEYLTSIRLERAPGSP